MSTPESTETQIEKVEIKLDNPDKTYFAGEKITGKICFFLTKKTKIRAINAEVTGKGKCKWAEIFNKDFNKTINPRYIFYTGKEVYLNATFGVPYVPPRGIELSPGTVEMQFTYSLPDYLPSSLKGNYGSIKYKLKFIIKKAWTFDERYSIPLTIIQQSVCLLTSRFNSAVQHEAFGNVSIFRSGLIKLSAEMSPDYLTRNEKQTLRVVVSNGSNIHVEKVRFTIVQRIYYHSTKPKRNTKREQFIIFTKEAGGVEKKSERSFAHEILVPACPPSCNTIIFSVSYTLNVEAVLPTFHKNILLSIETKMYSHDRNKQLRCDRPISYQPSSLRTTNSSCSPASRSSLSPAQRSADPPDFRLNETECLDEIRPTEPSDSSLRNFPVADIIFSRMWLSENVSNVIEQQFLESVLSELLPNNQEQQPPSTVFISEPINRINSRDQANELPPSYEDLFGTATSRTTSTPDTTD